MRIFETSHITSLICTSEGTAENLYLYHRKKLVSSIRRQFLEYVFDFMYAASLGSLWMLRVDIAYVKAPFHLDFPAGCFIFFDL